MQTSEIEWVRILHKFALYRNDIISIICKQYRRFINATLIVNKYIYMKLRVIGEINVRVDKSIDFAVQFCWSYAILYTNSTISV